MPESNTVEQSTAEPSVSDVLTRVFTTTNPETGSEPPEYIAWVIFENETVYLTGPSETLPKTASPSDLSKAAMVQLIEFGPPLAGTPSADFRASRLPWYPDRHIYMVSYNHPNLLNIVISDEPMKDLAAGLVGRSARGADAEEPTICEVRDFGGQSYLAQPAERIGKIDYPGT